MTNVIERLRERAGRSPYGYMHQRKITACESIVIADHIVALEAEVEMLRSVAEELRLKYETEEENAKQQRYMKTKARAERDALAAQVEVVRHAWESVKATDYDRILDEALELTPAACLAQVRAEAIKEAVNANKLGMCNPPDDPSAEYQAYTEALMAVWYYAERIRQGGAE